jgi:hypothetical protein
MMLTNPNFCKDGTVAEGPRTFMRLVDGTECDTTRPVCLTKNKSACVQ